MPTLTTTPVTTPVTTTIDVPMVASTCPACDSHNVSDANGPGACNDCGLTDNLSAFMGGGMTSRAKFVVSQYAKSGGKARSFPRAFTISGSID